VVPVSETPDPDLVVIGRVVKAHGIRGEVSVHVMTDLPERFAPGAEVLLGDEPTTVVSSRPHQGRMLVGFEGIGDRTAAERLRGRDIAAPALDLDDRDTYFVHELVGATVVAADDRDLGTVSALIELPGSAGYDLLEVTRDDGTTWLLPAADDLVEVEEDGEDDTLRLRVVDPPEGLVDGEPDEARSPGETAGEEPDREPPGSPSA
jgi:16S rRNA processing protein RimM